MSTRLDLFNEKTQKLQHEEVKSSQANIDYFQDPPNNFHPSMFEHFGHDNQISKSSNLEQRNWGEASQIISIEEFTEKSSPNIQLKGKKIRKGDGCRCKKNACGNQYCSCTKLGKKCGSSCECVGCKNHRFVKLVRCKIEDFWQNSWEYKNNIKGL